MKTIEINNIPILISLRFEESFKNLTKYETLKKARFHIESKNESIIIPRIMPSITTKFYEIYEYSDIRIQSVHDLVGNIIGYLKYEDSKVTIYGANSFEHEYMLSQYALVYVLKKEGNAIFMHGSSFKYKNKGIILTAKSGTGKSTHRALWDKLFDIEIINDDKNIISLRDDKLYICSSPWSGKHQLDNNITSTLDAIVILYQSSRPEVKKLSLNELLPKLLPSLENLDSENKKIWHEIFSHILKTPIIYFGCNMLDESAIILEKELNKLWD